MIWNIIWFLDGQAGHYFVISWSKVVQAIIWNMAASRPPNNYQFKLDFPEVLSHMT